MSRDLQADEGLDRLMTAWLDERAQGGDAELVLDAVLARTVHTRPIPAWRLPERWVPVEVIPRIQPVARLVTILVVIALALLVIGFAIVGSQPRLPSPFGLAANGRVAYVSGGHIFTADADGGAPLAVTSDALNDATPVFSRDGTRIAFKRLTLDNTSDDVALHGDLVVVNADGSNPLVIDSGTTSMSPTAWSPDSRFLLYSKAFGPGVEQIYVAAADGSRPPQRISDAAMVAWGPGWSPSGDLVSYMGGASDPQLFVMKPDGSERRRLTQGDWRLIGDGVSWSPDGRSLLFGAGDIVEQALWIVGLDGAAEGVVVPHRAWEGLPAWSPDGTRFAYLERTIDGQGRVHVASADGTGDRTLPGTYGLLPAVWSPDGTKIVVTDDTTSPPRVVILDASGEGKPSVISVDLPTSSAPAVGADTPSWQRTAP